ncbi:MAG: GNAT family N-acetyltransferase [Rectinemataceae bacterium]
MRQWVKAGARDLPQLERFLRSRETYAASFIAKLLWKGKLSLPLDARAGVWIRAGTAGEDPVEAAILGLAGGAFYPQLPSADADLPGLARLLEPVFRGILGVAGNPPATVTGPARSVAAFEAAFRLSPAWKVDYRLMALPASRSVAPEHPHPGTIGTLRVERAGPGDLEALVPLQKAYEIEEVIIPLHVFDAEASRAWLSRMLRTEFIAKALRDGQRGAVEILGKAGTNARAFTIDQIGGVFVRPEIRGRGIARGMMDFLIARLGAEGRGTALFVKKGNAAALALYRGLGYATIDDYRADYL